MNTKLKENETNKSWRRKWHMLIWQGQTPKGRVPYIKKTGQWCWSYLLWGKKQFWFLLGCSVSKGPQPELLLYLLGYWAKKIWQEIFENQLTKFNFFLELAPLKDEKNFKPHSQNKILVPLRGSFQNVWPASLFLIWEAPPATGILLGHLKEETNILLLH